ncbi:MAG: ribonuclease P protein component [Bacteroidales bacterium]|nr:ribonuclease P protein component [Candidatus Liminaster caballi]
MKTYTLPKTERLYLRDAISQLYAKGSSFMVFPYRVVYRVLPDDDSQVARVAIMTVAPKKRFKHAVDRNHVKRLTREAYRTAKLPLIETCEQQHCRLAFAMLYCDSRFISFADTQKCVGKIIRKLQNSVTAPSTETPKP